MRAFNLARVDKQYDMHLQAWLNHQVTATKNVGSKEKSKVEPVFKNFDSFFDYKKALNKVDGPIKQSASNLTNKQKRMIEAARKLNKKGG